MGFPLSQCASEIAELDTIFKGVLRTFVFDVLVFRWLVNHMLELGFSKSLAEWIGSNLKKSGDHETWAFNLEGAVQMFDSYR